MTRQELICELARRVALAALESIEYSDVVELTDELRLDYGDLCEIHDRAINATVNIWQPPKGD